MATLHTLLPVSPSLAAAVLKSAPPTMRRAPTPLRKRTGSPPVKGSDAAILEVRRLREQVGLGPTEIARHMTAIGHHMAVDRVHKICNYATRSNLVPALGAAPYVTGPDA